ncbi:phosphatase PAP2 family protein [Microlunatus sp. Gsoil 973]|uniref:phosphatase PAP2 family protein n=1 Tax=Microlunatus sp. Gsoil 973 TaxID=2672569 RepID=UPI0012B4B6FA|nr:phosphatase PAP2 family protein [Microlunatus sp. Gsoil 973]QGN34213.1 phosphatase PAP2 family protein [Microlunatus sp. Gsoil 973]
MALITQRPSVARPDGYGSDFDRRRPRRVGPSPAASALPLAFAAVAGMVATVLVALHTAFGQEYDNAAMRVLSHGHSNVNDQLIRLLQQVSTVSAAVALAIMVGVALVRRRFRVAVAAVVLVVGANLTTQLLKDHLLSRPDLGVGEAANTLPSGHTTLVFSLVLAAVLVSPRALRWFVTLGGAAIGGLTGLATIIAAWHRPSDVVAGMLVTLAWAALMSAIIAGRSPDGVVRYGGGFPALLGGSAAALGVIVYGFDWTAGPDASKVIPITAGVIAAVAAMAVGCYSSLVSRTSN